jgi:hypothetical protein
MISPYQSYGHDMKLGGLVYLHDISRRHMIGAARKDLDEFRKLGGEQAAKSIILGTTRWRYVLPEVGKRREEDLKSHFWQKMIGSGWRVERFEDTTESAWGIVNIILDSVEETHGPRLELKPAALSRNMRGQATQAMDKGRGTQKKTGWRKLFSFLGA